MNVAHMRYRLKTRLVKIAYIQKSHSDMTIPLLILLIFMFFNTPIASSQDVYDSARAAYYKNIGNQAAIYNGTIYQQLTNLRSGHPFFKSNSMLNGSVLYDGVFFQNIPLMLDESKDELITEDYGRGNLLQLVKEKVEHFTIAGQKFIRVSNENGMSFYQQLYAGKSKVLKREIKTIETRIANQSETEKHVSAKTRYYIEINGGVYEVRNKKAVLRLFGEHRSSISRYLNEINSSYRADTGNYLIEACKRYDELSR
jgi:hypothetical protein